MTTYALSDRSTVTLETRAKGMLAKLAHDLSILATPALEVVSEGDEILATLRFAPAAIRVDGVRKGSIVDRAVLSASDKRDIEQKMRGDVLGGRDVVARITVDVARIPAEGEARLDVRPRVSIGGREREISSVVTLARKGAQLEVRAQASVSMDAFGIPPVKGPLNAFRVDDRIDVACALTIDVVGD